MARVESRRLKFAIASVFAKKIGFKSLSDSKTIIFKRHLLMGISFLRENRETIIKVFKGYCRAQLRRDIRVNTVIKIFRTMLRDPAINRAVQTKKINFKSEAGTPTSGYCYRILK